MNSNCVVLTSADEQHVRDVTAKYMGRELSHLEIILDDELFNTLREVMNGFVDTTPGEARVADWCVRLDEEFRSDARRATARRFASEMLGHDDVLDFSFDDLDEILGAPEDMEALLGSEDVEALLGDMGASGLLGTSEAVADMGSMVDMMADIGGMVDMGKIMAEFAETPATPSIAWTPGNPNLFTSLSTLINTIHVDTLSENMSARVTYPHNMLDINGTLTALVNPLEPDFFVAGRRDQYFTQDVINPVNIEGSTTAAVVTLDCDSILPPRFVPHPCVVFEGKQVCCTHAHFTVMLDCETAISMLGMGEVCAKMRASRLQKLPPPLPPSLGRGRIRPRSSPESPASSPPKRKRAKTTRTNQLIRHETIFRVACEILKEMPELTVERGTMMRALSQRQEIADLFPEKANKKNGVYHSLRNVFQSARMDEFKGNTYYTPQGLAKMDPWDPKTRNVIWTYRVSCSVFKAQYIV